MGHKMMKPNKTKTMQQTLEELDLATDSDIILRTVPKAGKARYTIRTSARTISPIASKYCPERNQKIAASRSVRTMQEIAHSNNIYWLTTLTFRDDTEPNKAKELFAKFKRTKRMQPFSPYICVLEGWEKGERTHLHLLVNKQTAQKLKTHWPHGTVDTRQVPWEELDNVCKYMGKKFAEINRPRGSRYTASKGIKPKTESHYFKNTIDSYKHLLDTAEGKDLSNNWSYNNGFGRGGEIIWNPNNTQIE